MVTVEDGLLTLEGTVEWDFQKADAEKAMQCIRGVKAVANLIEVAPTASPADIQKRIEKVTARDQVAGLSSNAHAWSDSGIAERAPWSVAGVVRVGDLLVAEPWRTG
jgi:hypothetical protein